jgi:hypothetical protein
VFASPTDRVATLTADASISRAGILEEHLIVYWTVPRDVRVTKTGELHPKLGGAHVMLYFEINMPRDFGMSRSNSWTHLEAGEPDTPAHRVYFPMPETYGEIGGGVVYDDAIVITRDGSSPFAPAPAGALLEIEIARHRKRIVEGDALAKRGLAELEASMAPEAIAARREKRAKAWGKPGGNQERLRTELDAAARTDEDSARRERERFSPPATRDPKSVYWSHRLALEALEAKLASLDAAGRAAAACVSTDARFGSGTDLRVNLVANAPRSCAPMVYRRPDLVDRARPTEPSVLYAWWSGRTCGEWWAKPLPVQDQCGRMLSLLHDMDWGLARKALGWQ